MTDNQFNQLFDSLTKLLEGIQRLEIGQAELKAVFAESKDDAAIVKSDFGEPEQSQTRLEMTANN